MRKRERRLRFGLIGGAASGVVLALLLKGAEAATGQEVYRLLLNVDFMPWVPRNMPEWAELALHMAVALPLGWVYLRLLTLWQSPLWLGLGVGLAVACCTWVPLTQLSERVPDTSDWGALGLWLAGHLGYGLALAAAGAYWRKKERRNEDELSIVYR